MTNYDSIPSELKKLKQWVCWSGDKLPKNPHTGNNAMSNNPKTWGSFEQAVEAVSKYHFDGIGFMFASGYFGIDLDDCIENEDFIDEFVETLQSYTEYSRSGRGIHIICKGQLPPGNRRKGNVEMYQTGRYFIMTGKPYKGIELPLRVCTEEVKVLHAKYLDTPISVMNTAQQVTEIELTDDEVIEKARNCASGSFFQLLFQGQWQGLYPSQSEADLAFCNHLAFWTQKKVDQMDRIFRRSKLYRAKWDRRQSGSTYGLLTIQKANAGVSEVYSPEMDETKIVVNVNKKNRPKIRKEYQHNDTGNAKRFADMFGETLRYSYQNKQWIFWDGRKWQNDITGEIKKLADLCIEDMTKHAFSMDDEDKKDALLKWVNKTCSSKVKTSMITEAQHLKNIPVVMDQFDRHKDFLNCQNGIINLRKGELMPHDPNYMMTRISFCEYDADTTNIPERWFRFLDEVTDGNKELQEYIQKAVGYSLTGSIREQCMFFCYGTGQNGKSTFLDVISNLMGTYASHAQPESIMIGQKGGGALTDIARLKGARFVTTVEPNEGVKLNEGLIKQLTGGDKVTARFLYGREFEFIPEFKLWLGANHKPVIRGTDLGIWRRIRLIPFTVQIPDEKVDKGLRHKLKKELPQIFRWAVEGCRMWIEDGLPTPLIIKNATEEYREEMDILGSFCEACIKTDYNSRLKASEIYDVYCHWVDENHEYKFSNTRFGKEFAKRFPEKMRLGDGYWYKNVTLTDYAKELIKSAKFGDFYDSRRKDISG